jgi:hypothetical protein
MTDSQQRAVYYRRLFVRLRHLEARNLIDRLQVLALTQPDTVRELETFLDRNEPRSPQPSDEAGCTGASPHS